MVRHRPGAGRVNLIGEHTDYNDGFVFPMAIEPHVLIACRSRDDSTVRLASTVFPGQIGEFSVDQPIEPGEPSVGELQQGRCGRADQGGHPAAGHGCDHHQHPARRRRAVEQRRDRSRHRSGISHAGGPEDGRQPPRADLPEGRARIRRRAGRHHGPDDRRVRQARARDAARLPRSVQAVCCRSIRRICAS